MSTSPRSSASATSCSLSVEESASGFSTKTCLPARSACARELEVRHDGRGDGDRVQSESSSSRSSNRVVLRASGKRAAVAREAFLVAVADPGEGRALELVEVAGEIGAPVTEADRA